MVLVFASELDEVTARYTRSWPRGRAALVAPSDLCSRGWRIGLGTHESDRLCTHDGIVAAADVSGAVNLLPFVPAHELVGVEEGDRAYVASELTAFLFYVLTALPCRILNRPSPSNLVGPDWKTEQWMNVCRRHGIPTRRPSGRSPAIDPRDGRWTGSFAVLNGVLLNCGDVPWASRLRSVADEAHVRFLQAHCARDDEGTYLASVTLVPNFADEAVRATLAEYFDNA